MAKLITKCPACQGQLKITTLQCPDCGMELKNSFEMNLFDRLDAEQYSFLIDFLKAKGNLKQIQEQREISYPTAKKQLDEMVEALGLAEKESPVEIEVADMKTFKTDSSSKKASEIIKTKLKECGGRTTIYTKRGLPCEIWVGADGESFVSDKLPITPPYKFEVFDYITDLLEKQFGRAKKGNGRNYRLGEPQCDESTVVGYIAKHYSGKNDGDSVFDPVFVFAAVLEWAGIVENGRGELILIADN